MNQYFPTTKEILTIMELLSGSQLCKLPSSIENLGTVCELLNEVTFLYSDILILLRLYRILNPPPSRGV